MMDLPPRLGRNDKPAAVARSWMADPDVPAAEMAREVADAWIGAEWPTRMLDNEVWMMLFGHAVDIGFEYIEGEEIKSVADLPERLTLYRGLGQKPHSEVGLYPGLSWTSNRERAVWFATRFGDLHGRPHLLTVTVDRSCVIAHFDRRGEDEYVLDPEAFFAYEIEAEEVGS
jgi:hypothetical protein